MRINVLITSDNKLKPLSNTQAPISANELPSQHGSSQACTFEGMAVELTYNDLPPEIKIYFANQLQFKDHASLRIIDKDSRNILTYSFVKRIFFERDPLRGPFLHKAAISGSFLNGQCILEIIKGTKPLAKRLDGRDPDGNTLMHYFAAMDDGVNAMEYLTSRKRGNRILGFSNRKQETALDVAVKHNNGAAVSFLLQQIEKHRPYWNWNKAGICANNYTLIHYACAAKDPSILKNILRVSKNKVELNILNRQKENALCLAAREGRSENVRSLIGHIKDNVESYDWGHKDQTGNTALHYIARKCDSGALKALLIAAGETLALDITSDNGKTPLHCALYAKNTEVVFELLRWIAERGMSSYCWNAQDLRKNTVAHLVTKLGDPELFKAIAVQAAEWIDYAAVNLNGKTPLHFAAKYQTAEMVEWLTRWIVNNYPLYNWNASDAMDRTVVFRAVARKDLGVLGAIVTTVGSMIDWSTIIEEKTVMHIAAEFYCAEVFAFLASRMPTLEWVNQRDLDGSTVVHRLAEANEVGGLKALDELTESRADFMAINTSGETPLHIAASLGNFAAVSFLMTVAPQHRNWNHQNDQGNTVGHLLAASDSSDAVSALERLLGHIDVHLVNIQGQTLLHRAASSGSPDMIALLSKHTPKEHWHLGDVFENTPIHYAVYRESAKTIKAIFTTGIEFDPRVVNKDGRTPLHLAVRINNLEVITLLLDAMKKRPVDYDWNRFDVSGETIIHSAAMNRIAAKAMRALISAAPDKNINFNAAHPTVMKRTPLMCAVALEANRGGDLEAIKMLANVCSAMPDFNWNAIDVEGNALVHLLISCREEVVQIVFDAGGAMIDPSLKDALGRPALLLALTHNAKSAHLYVKLAARHGYDWHKREPGFAPLSHCAMTCSLDVVKTVSELANTAFDVREKDSRGLTPLDKIAANVQGLHPDVAYFYLDLAMRQHFDWNEQDEKGNTLLHKWAAYGHPYGVAAILKFAGDRFDFSKKNSFGNTPLHEAVLKPTGLAYITEARQRKLPLDEVSEKKWSLLHFAAVSAELDVIELLLSGPCDLTLRNESGDTPVHLAVAPALLPNTIAATMRIERASLFLSAAVKQNFDFGARGSSTKSLLELVYMIHPPLMKMLLTEASKASENFQQDVRNFLQFAPHQVQSILKQQLAMAGWIPEPRLTRAAYIS